MAQRLAQGGVWAEPIGCEQRQGDRGIPGGGQLGEGVGLAGEAGEPVAQHAIEAVDVHGIGLCRGRPDYRPDLLDAGRNTQR